MHKGKSLSLVFPAYNEEENIASAIKDFKKLKIIDEIIVVDNNSIDSTGKIAKKFGARVVLEKKQGYGFALRRGMKEAKGDLIVLCEPDGTFQAKDLKSLLKHSESCDIVMGSRTNSKYISKGANMKTMLRLGNYMLARLTQFLYKPAVSLTDCGCTFRVLKKQAVKKILPELTVGGTYFLAELLVISLNLGFSMKEVPVHYRKRIGESKITGSLSRSVLVGLLMFKTILSHRFAVSR